MNHYCPTCRHHLNRVGVRCNCGHYWDESRFDTFGFDISDGDLVVNMGGGLGIDTRTGELELEIAPGVDIPLGGDGDGFGW